MPLVVMLAVGLATALHAQVVGDWQFNEKAPGNNCDTTLGAILDSSGNAHHGTEPNPLPYLAGAPGYGTSSALSFNQIVTNRVLVPDPGGFFNWSSAQSVTMEAVVRTVNIGSSVTGTILAKQVASPGEWYWRITPTGMQRLSANDGTGIKSAVGTRVLNDGQWHHLAAVYDATAQRMQVYVDYVADGPGIATTFTSTIGNTNDLWIGQQQSGANRLDGDIDFVRFSLGALNPTNFILPQTYLANITPTNNAIFIASTNAASFSVISPTVGVASSNILVSLNGVDVSGLLAFSGTANNRTVTLPALSSNLFYQVQVSVTDLAGYQFSQSWQFNTFAASSFSIEGEDYNFGGGQFINYIQLSSVPGVSNYLDRLGTEGIDFHQVGAPTLAQYRIGDLAGTAVAQDVLRQAILDAKVLDPGVTDYMEQDNVDGEWLDYTRTFPASTYYIYARIAKAATTPIVMSLSEVISSSTTSNQVTKSIANFQSASTGSASAYQFVPLADALGKNVGYSLSGVRTLRQTFVSGSAGTLLNYFVFVPAGALQVPYLTQVSPAVGASNAAFFSPIQASLQNADTSVVTNTIQLKLDGTPVTLVVVTGTALGVDLSYNPSSLSTGSHTATLIFTDSAATSVTNEWQFGVSRAAPVFTTSVWTNKSAGLWSGIANWTNGIVANGSGVTADFSTVTLPANTTVTLDTPATAGYLVFGDLGNAFNWTLTNSGGSTLTLDTGTNTPVITVLGNRNTTIGAALASYNGLLKAGTGTLTLTAANAYDGSTEISAGTLQIGANSGITARAGTGPIQIGASGSLTFAYGASMTTFANNLTGTGTIAQNGLVEVGLTGTNTFSGLVQINSNKLAFATARSADGAPRLAIASGAVMSIGSSFAGGTLTLSELSGAGGINPTFGSTTGFRTLNVNQSSTTTFSGSIKDGSASRFVALVKSGPGTLILNNSGNTYTGLTTVSNGTLMVNNATGTGVGPGTVTVVSNATLAGNGIIGGPVTVDAGGLIVPGTNAIGTLTFSNSLTINGNLAFKLNKSLAASNSLVSVVGSLDNTGTGQLTVTNIGPGLVAGETFKLFNKAITGGQNLTIVPPLGVTFTNNLAVNGTITVLTAPPLVNSTPTNLVVAVSPGQLTLSWPADHTGWTLQAQTNSLSVGLRTNWFSIAGSTTTNQMTMPVNPSDPAVFYRLSLP